MQTVFVIGGGAWGTALAETACRAGQHVTLWAREPEVVDSVNTSHENALFLPGVRLSDKLSATTDMAAAGHADIVLLVPPAQHLRATAKALAPHLPETTPLVICAKGIELATGALMTDIVAQELPGRPVAVLSGPTFAIEVAKGLPTAITLASTDETLAQKLVQALGSRAFRPYVGTDPVGVEIGGAVKNVIAITCGIVAGLGLGDNARAALMTRGLAEMVRLGAALGAKAETFMGLAGLGDLDLTCNAMQSRNFSFGVALGQGRAAADILAERRAVTEGVATAPAVAALAQKLGVDMPICAALAGILENRASLQESIETLLSRPFKTETA